MCISRSTILIFGMICLSAASGCIRSYRETRGVAGRLVDATSGKPISEVPITVTIDDHRAKEVSSRDGRFDVKPRYRLVLWIAGEYGYGPPVIEIGSEGYELYKIGGDWGLLREDDDYVRLEDVHLRKRQAASSPEKVP